MKYTKESLQNTWGIVESKEHADYISEQCKSVGIISSDTWRCEYGYFSISLNELLFWGDESHANCKGKKQITIPLPPKAEKPDFSKLPIHFDCVCNKCGGKCCIGNCDEWSKVGDDKAMNNIKWKDGAVCFAGGEQYSDVFVPVAVMAKDFQLNEIRQGDYIEASELDTEQKYNDVVEVFELFGFKRFDSASYADTIKAKTDSSCLKVNPSGKLICNWYKGVRQLTCHQIMTIGELKRAMTDFEKFNRSDIPQSEKRNKSKQAYEVLKSLDYDYDLDKQKWFKKHYI